MGLPLVILGPQEKAGLRRPALSVLPVADQELKLDRKAMRRDFPSYRKERADWVKRRSGKVIGFSEPRDFSWKGSGPVQSVGTSYRIGAETFHETSYYVSCGRRVYHLKTLLTEDTRKNHGRELQGIVRSFRCR